VTGVKRRLPVASVPETPVSGTSIVAPGRAKIGGILIVRGTGFRDSVEPRLRATGSITAAVQHFLVVNAAASVKSLPGKCPIQAARNTSVHQLMNRSRLLEAKV
jgi:hypothetical protein